MSSSNSDNISAGWYIAFFLGGALLGLLLLNYFGVDASLPSWSVSQGEKESIATPAGKAESSMTKRGEPSAQSAPTPANEHAPLPNLANTASTEQMLEPEPLICDKKSAEKIRNKAREVAEIVGTESQLVVRLRKEWEFYSDSVRRSFVERFVDSDTCLNGQSRAIQFIYQGKLFATADPEQGVVFE